MENNNYVSVGNIIEQERLKRQAQIAKGVSSDVYDHIEKAHNDDLNDNIEKSDNLTRFETDIQDFNKAETELLLYKIQRQLNADSESMLLKAMKSIAINHYNDIEKAGHGIYEDNAENRRLNRVGQEYGHAAEQKEPISKQPKKQEEAGGGIQFHAAKASDEALKRAAADEKAKPEVREVAKKELEKRNASTEKKKNVSNDEEYQNEDLDADEKQDPPKMTPAKLKNAINYDLKKILEQSDIHNDSPGWREGAYQVYKSYKNNNPMSVDKFERQYAGAYQGASQALKMSLYFKARDNGANEKEAEQHAQSEYAAFQRHINDPVLSRSKFEFLTFHKAED